MFNSFIWLFSGAGELNRDYSFFGLLPISNDLFYSFRTYRNVQIDIKIKITKNETCVKKISFKSMNNTFLISV